MKETISAAAQVAVLALAVALLLAIVGRLEVGTCHIIAAAALLLNVAQGVAWVGVWRR